MIERFFILPLDYSKPTGPTVRVFARNLIPLDKAKTKEEEEKLPYCKFLVWSGLQVILKALLEFCSCRVAQAAKFRSPISTDMPLWYAEIFVHPPVSEYISVDTRERLPGSSVQIIKPSRARICSV